MKQNIFIINLLSTQLKEAQEKFPVLEDEHRVQGGDSS